MKIDLMMEIARIEAEMGEARNPLEWIAGNRSRRKVCGSCSKN
jgi:hypothetical protein